MTWDPISLLPSEQEVYTVSYTVYYSRVLNRKRQGEQSVTTSVPHAVFVGLTLGVEYRFQVAAVAEGNGMIIEGQRSQIDDASSPVLPEGKVAWTHGGNWSLLLPTSRSW